MRTKECAYCAAEATTVDHVPPQSLFSDGIDLITVPSCEHCAPSFSKDDELFKIFLAKCGRSGNPVAEDHLTGSILRCLRDHSPGLRKKIQNQTKVVQQITPHGIYIGPAHVLEVTDADWKRIQRVLERIVRGYYFLRSGKRYDGYRFLILDAESPMFPEIMAKLPGLEDVIIKGVPFKTPDTRVFLGKFIVQENDPEESHLWTLCFFEKKFFLVFVVKDDQHKE